MQPRKWLDVVCDLDYSGHDNNCSEDLLVVSFAFLRLCFPKSIKIDRLFYYCMSSLIFKRVVLPGSNLVYKLCRGVSTGHAFTSLITTMCAYVTLATSVDKACSITGDTSESRQALLDSTRIGNAGDDCNIRLNSSLVTKVYDIISEESGHKIDDMRENGYIDSTNVDSRVTFLKKQFYDFHGICLNC